jgi:membrane-associated phospholipid phosphatase
VSRRRRVLRFGVGALLFLGSREEARRVPLPGYEERIFRAANEAPESIRVPVRSVMQAGTFVTAPIVAVVAALTGRRRLAANLLVGGTAAWLGAKVAKLYGGRERPARVLHDVHLREGIEGDLGWVSGHTAVATTLAYATAEAFPSVGPALASVVAMTGFGRMYVGAHLPHDLIGGAGLGMMISSLLPPTGGR